MIRKKYFKEYVLQIVVKNALENKRRTMKSNIEFVNT